MLADLAEWTGTRPSALLTLAEMGLPDAVCLDFDFAVRALKRWADRREAATHLVSDTEPDRKQRMKAVPTYPTLATVLGLAMDDTPTLTTEDRSTARDLADAMAGGTVNWEAFGLT